MNTMQHSTRRFGGRQRGQGMTEYIIIVALIAIAAIGVFTFFGGTLRSQMAVASKELGGQTATAETARVTTQSGKAVTEGTKDKNLKEYSNQHN